MEWLKTFWSKSFTDWRYRVLLHAVFWFIELFFATQESIVVKINWEQHFSVTLVGIAFELFLFYPLVYVIVPLIQKRRWVVALALFVPYYMIAVVVRDYHIRQIVNMLPPPGHHWYFAGQDFWKRVFNNESSPLGLITVFLSSIPGLLEPILMPLTVKFIRYTYRVTLKQAWLTKENSQLQLATLKAQLNPHFFFNTLNNLQSYIVQNEKEKSVDLLTRLADFMRSSLYDGEQDSITMVQEIALLHNYTEIERIRFDDNAAASVKLINNDPNYEVPPFIFLPFVENVFKHGASQTTENIFIDIELVNDKEHLTLKTKNTYIAGQALQGGIGLQNVRKRLDYYFPGRYTLDIEKSERFYMVMLTICK